jgi:hypothetical protein
LIVAKYWRLGSIAIAGGLGHCLAVGLPAAAPGVVGAAVRGATVACGVVARPPPVVAGAQATVSTSPAAARRSDVDT